MMKQLKYGILILNEYFKVYCLLKLLQGKQGEERKKQEPTPSIVKEKQKPITSIKKQETRTNKY